MNAPEPKPEPLSLTRKQQRQLSAIMAEVCKALKISPGKLHAAIGKAVRAS